MVVVSLINDSGRSDTTTTTTATTVPVLIRSASIARDLDRSVARTSHRLWVVSVDCPQASSDAWAAGQDCTGLDTGNGMPVDVFVTVTGRTVTWDLYEGVPGDETLTPWTGITTVRS